VTTESTAGSIALRFDDERESIERYVRFLLYKTAIRDQEILDLNQILRRVQVKPLPTRRYERTSESFTRAGDRNTSGRNQGGRTEVYQRSSATSSYSTIPRKCAWTGLRQTTQVGLKK